MPKQAFLQKPIEPEVLLRFCEVEVKRNELETG
jgi:hypothetical protein